MRALAARLRGLPAWWPAVVLAAAYLATQPATADLAAQRYRTWLFEAEGFAVWDNGWYAGHHVPGYSLLFPPLAALLGPALTGALAAVAAAVAFERLVGGRFEAQAVRTATLWFAAGTAVSLFTGRLTFALGLAFGVAALAAAGRGRPLTGALLAALTAAASPVAGAFLALLAVAWWLHRRSWVAVGLAAAALAPALALREAFPEGGTFPFEPDAFWPSLGATLVVLAAIPRDHRLLRAGAALYALALAGAFVTETAMGGNAVRLGAIVAGPVAALALLPGRARVLAVLAPALVYWQWTTPVDDVVRATGDPSVEAGYYRGLIAFLTSRDDGPFRVEIPFTDNHWEAAHVAPHVPLARGWERQLDREVNALFYDGRALTPLRYHRWLQDNAVRYVALHDAPMDYSAAAEARLVRAGPRFLRPVWRDAHWRVYEVREARPLADGATAVALGPQEVVLDAPHAGELAVRVRFTPYWRLEGSAGCVLRRRDGWTAVRVRRPGRVRLVADFAPGQIGADHRCT